mgnify:CR=1 FL=1
MEETALSVSGAGVYALSGRCADGSVKVEAQTEDVVLLLDGLTLTSADTAPIVCGESTGVTIAVVDGTENTLTDSEANDPDNAADNENAEKAVVKCKDGSQVVLCGGGALTVNARGKNGIKSGTALDDRDASLTIRELTLNIEALVNDAINAEQRLKVESGKLTIAAGEDAIHCDMELNIGAEGTTGPAITVSTCSEGLEGAVLNIHSGNMDITSTDDCLNAANSDLGDYAFEINISGGTITISGGTVLAAGGSSSMGMNLEAAQPCVIYGSTGFGGMPGSTQSSLIAADADFTIEDADGNAVYSGTARCGANFILFSSADVVADSAYTLKAGDSSTEGNAQSGTVSTGMGMGGGFPGGGQKPDGEPPESFDGQMPNGEKSELPDGEVPEMPSGERPTPPSGQGSPADGNAPAGDSTSDTTPTA